MFIAEKGPECFTEKKDAIISCVNSTFGHYVPEKAPTSDNLPELIIGQEECKYVYIKYFFKNMRFNFFS